MFSKKCLLASAAIATLFPAAIAQAQDETTVSVTDAPLTAEKIVVIGTIPYRNRSEETEPILEYDAEYFQRFEPLTAGDALRRVPSVTFLSDVLESDGPRFRGLAPSYAQLLINGERVPGGENDRSFFLDRIPAELIERVEIIRSTSARRTGDAVAGALNIVLRDGADLDGGYARAGALIFDDGEVKPSLGVVYGGEVGPGRILLGGNLQGRYNPKIKNSTRFDNPTDLGFDNREDQTDTRDGTDYSVNARYTVDLPEEAEFEVGGFVTYTDREESERSFEYDDPTAISGPVPTGNLLTDNQQQQDIEQTSYAIDTSYERQLFGGVTDFRLGFASYEEDRTNAEDEIKFENALEDPAEDVVSEQELELTDISDQELTFEVAQTWDLSDNLAFETGIYWQDKERDTEILTGDQEVDFTGSAAAWNQFVDFPFSLRTTEPDVSAGFGNDNTIEETRLDIYGVFNGENGPLSWEAGLRYETTETDITDNVTPTTIDNDYNYLLPSASLKYDLTEVDRIILSGGRTVRRPEFDQLFPGVLEEEIEDEDFAGNPELEPETAWGVDIGYERRIAETGIVGINVFYRQVEDLIEIANTLEEGSAGEGTFVFQPQNTGDGDVYGIEFDISTPLSMFGLPDTGFFASYSYLDSEVDDVFGSRRFNDQSEYVYNIGFIHTLTEWDAAFGATFREQGDAFGRVVAEEVTTSYGEDLEIFVEKSFAGRYTLRVVGQNLLNASKDETFNKFDSQADQIARDFDEFELETEDAGPVVQIMLRASF